MGRIVTREELQRERARLKERKSRVVFTNGCFDILHRGHIEYLAQAKALGDALIVGVNTDNSIHRIKGPSRPIVNEYDRAFLVANLVPVDFATLFDEETPWELIRAIVPDVLVKGADWDISNIIGRDIVEGAGGRVETIALTPGHSTTAIIDTIMQKACRQTE